MQRYNSTQSFLPTYYSNYNVTIDFVSEIIYEEVDMYEIIMGNLHPFMYHLYSKYKIPGKDNFFKYWVLITIPGSCHEHFLGSKLVHHLYYEDDKPFLSLPITIPPRQFGGHSYYIKYCLE